MPCLQEAYAEAQLEEACAGFRSMNAFQAHSYALFSLRHTPSQGVGVCVWSLPRCNQLFSDPYKLLDVVLRVESHVPAFIQFAPLLVEGGGNNNIVRWFIELTAAAPAVRATHTQPHTHTHTYSPNSGDMASGLAVVPPSTGRIAPVTHAPAGEARNTVAPPMSAAEPRRFSGTVAAMAFSPA